MSDDVYLPEAYELLKLSGIYYVVGMIDEGDLTDIHMHILMKTLTPEWNRPIHIFLNSVGGDCQEGWALIDLIDWAKQNGNIVKTIGMGQICSMASCILAAGSTGHRMLTKNCEMMIHAPIIGHMAGNLHQIAETTIAMKAEHARHERFWVEHSKYRTVKAIRENFLGREDHWLSPDEALEHGIADAIAGTLKVEENVQTDNVPPKKKQSSKKKAKGK